MRFEKWEAVGNDFVLLDASEARAAWGEAWLDSARVRRWCDRRRGIGADGVLVIDGLSGGRPSMSVVNADGSRAEMCGNGLRCAAGYVAEQRGIDGATISVDTDVGPLACAVARRGAGRYEVSVAMGSARVAPPEPFDGPSGVVDLHRVDVGNPHAVAFDVSDDAALDVLGPAVDQGTSGGCNLELCRVLDGGRRLEVVVYERGVGRTLACGTGACAAAAAAFARRLDIGPGAFTVAMPGGDLEVAVEPSDEPGVFGVQLSGPAVRVFRGELDD
jgi:diaminopimelate epimerase